MTIFPQFALVARAFQGEDLRRSSPLHHGATVAAVILLLANAPHLSHATQNEAAAAPPLQSQLLTITEQLQLDPQNPGLQLKKGVLLAQIGQTQEAMEIFNKLRLQYPQQAASYINLASLYAQVGRLEDARQMLLLADGLPTDRYTTQLGLASLNLELALQAYDTAVALRPGDPLVQRRRESLSRLLQAGADTTATSTSIATGTPAHTQVESQGQALASSPATPTPPQAQRVPAGDRLTLSAEIPSVATTSRATTVGATVGDDTQTLAVKRTLDTWTRAWSQKSFDGYLAHYSERFQPNRGLSFSQWTARKRTLIEQAKYIQVDVQIESLRIVNDVATVRVQQTYRSDMYADKSRKEIQLQKQDGNWKITREQDLP